MKRSDADNGMADKGDTSSSDEGNSAMVSDGDRSGSSSPPSAGDMSFILDESAQEASTYQVHPNQVPSEMLLPADQLVALAAMLPPTEGRCRTDTMDTSIEQAPVKPAAKTTTNADGESPLSYKSLEEQASSIGSNSQHHGAETGEQPLGVPALHRTDVSDSGHSTSKVAATSSESTSAPLKMITMKGSPKLGTTKAKQGPALRRGKWTVEEEAYVARVIQDFNSGFLDAPAGTTLRTYLSEKLKCDPMRITKKFTGDACIGKRVFHPAVRSSSNAAAIDKAQVRMMQHRTLLQLYDELTRPLFSSRCSFRQS
jgi:hypothetical protein